MSKIETKLFDTSVKDVLKILYHRLRACESIERKKTRNDDYPDGITHIETLIEQLGTPYLAEEETLTCPVYSHTTLNPTLFNEPESHIHYDLVDTLVFTGFQVQKNVLLVYDEYEIWREPVNSILSELRKLFPEPKTVQPAPAETAQVDLTPKATPQSPIIFQGDYVAGNKEDHSIHVGNISNSAGIAIGESARVNIAQSEKPQEPKAIPQPETNSGQSQYENAVFVSYAWGDESERIVDELEQAFAKRGICIERDIKEVGYKDSIEAFEQRIGQGQCIILVISDKYLRSEHCMYELMEADKHKNLRERIFPIVLADAQIYKAIDRLNYIQHWDEQTEKLNQAIKKVNVMTNLGSITADLDKYARIRASFDHLTDLLSDMNALTPEVHAASGFSTLIDAVVRAMPPK
ncbi:MAG: toll/interleukin-1 receptor domain-containing protein [Anaerolineales bacterium]